MMMKIRWGQTVNVLGLCSFMLSSAFVCQAQVGHRTGVGNIKGPDRSFVPGYLIALSAPPAEVGRPPARSQTRPNQGPTTGRDADSSLYIELRLNQRVKLSALRPGDVVEGELSRDVYSGERKVFQSGSAIRLTVGELQRRRKDPNPNWPAVIKLFMSRHESYPSFQSATVSLPGGIEVPLRVSLISAGYKKDLHARLRTKEKTLIQTDGRRDNQTRETGSDPIAGPLSTRSAGGASRETMAGSSAFGMSPRLAPSRS